MPGAPPVAAFHATIGPGTPLIYLIDSVAMRPPSGCIKPYINGASRPVPFRSERRSGARDLLTGPPGEDAIVGNDDIIQWTLRTRPARHASRLYVGLSCMSAPRVSVCCERVVL